MFALIDCIELQNIVWLHQTANMVCIGSYFHLRRLPIGTLQNKYGLHIAQQIWFDMDKHAGRLIDAGLINFDMGEYNIQHAGRLVKFRNIGIESSNSNSEILELKRAQY